MEARCVHQTLQQECSFQLAPMPMLSVHEKHGSIVPEENGMLYRVFQSALIVGLRAMVLLMRSCKVVINAMIITLYDMQSTMFTGVCIPCT